MMNSVYLCGWVRAANGFELWMQSQPQIRSNAPTFAEAEASLADALVAAGGPHYSVFEFVPAPPRSEFDQRYSHPALYMISGDERFQTDQPQRGPFETDAERVRRESWCDPFFVEPCCRNCSQPGGRRSSTRLRVTHAAAGCDGAFVLFGGATLRLFAEAFLEQLSSDETRNLQFQPVERGSRARKRFFELIGPSGPPEVAVAGLDFNGWRCRDCGAAVFRLPYSPDRSIGRFIARGDLPNPLPSVFTVGTQPSVSLCMTADRWAQMVGGPGTRGILSQLLGVAPDEEVVRHPQLPQRGG